MQYNLVKGFTVYRVRVDEDKNTEAPLGKESGEYQVSEIKWNYSSHRG